MWEFLELKSTQLTYVMNLNTKKDNLNRPGSVSEMKSILITNLLFKDDTFLTNTYIKNTYKIHFLWGPIYQIEKFRNHLASLEK
jgi:hypothetical protein